MRLTPFFAWLLSFVVTNAAFVALPRLRYGIAFILLCHFALLAIGIVNVRSQFFGKVYFRGKKNDRRIALTFDDGPDPGLTGDILDALGRHGMKATFFVIARNVERFPYLVKRAFNEGHTIACHDLDHLWTSNFRMTRALFQDIRASQRIIEEVIGKKPRLYRPPMGLMNPHTPIALARLNMVCVGWSERLHDSGNRRLQHLSKMPALAKPGALIMLHDCLPMPEHKLIFLGHFEKLLKTIREKGLDMVGADELTGLNAYD
jgi:peptidoglycan-N-acetylglucosamine deacetylase